MFPCFRQPSIKCRNLSNSRFSNFPIIRNGHNGSVHTVSFDGPNRALLNYLFERYKREKIMKPNSLKLPGMLRTIKSVHKLESRFTMEHDPQSISGVNDAAALDIIKFFSLKKNATRILSDVNSDALEAEEIEKLEAIKQLQKVNGIGPIGAHILWESGCRSIEQLTEDRFLDLLPGEGRRIFEAYEKKTDRTIPRKVVECFANSLRETVSGEFEIHLVGKYRLGHEHLPGVDILLFHPTYTSLPRLISKIEVPGSHHTPTIYPDPPKSLFKESVMNKIRERGLEVITFSSDIHWDGLVKIDDEVLGRTRFYLMPMASKAAALLTFTGSPIFVNDCQHKARKKGFRLNEYGLWHSDVRGPTNTSPIWKPLETPDEAALLQNLDIPYVKPHKRELTGKRYSGVQFSEEFPPWHVTKYIPVAIQNAQIITAPKSENIQKNGRRSKSIY